MFGNAIISILLAVMAVLFLLGSIGEKEYQNKVMYAAVGLVLFVLLLLSTLL